MQNFLVFFTSHNVILILLFFILVFFLCIYIYIELYKRSFWIKYKKHIIFRRKIFQILFPKDNKYTSLSYNRFLQTLHNLTSSDKDIFKYIFSFEIHSDSSNTIFVIVLSERYADFVLGQLYSEFPDVQIKEITDPFNYFRNIDNYISIYKKNSFNLQLNTTETLGNNAIGSLIASLSNLQKDERTCFQLVIMRSSFKEPKVDSSNDIKVDVPSINSTETPNQSNAQNIDSNKNQNINRLNFFTANIRIIVQGSNNSRTKQVYADVLQTIKQFNNEKNSIVFEPFKQKGKLFRFFLSFPSISGYSKPILTPYNIVITRLIDKFDDPLYSYSTKEISSFYYFPNESVTNPKIQWLRSRKIPFPINLPFYNSNAKKEDMPRIFAMTDYRGINKVFGIKKMDRRRHFYLLGKSGTGKSTLLKNLIMGDIYYGEGVGVLDPHGDLIEEILDMIPPHRENDVILIDPSDQEYPIGLNMLDIKEGETKELLADGIVSVFKRFFSDSWGPRLQYILTNTILTLLYCQNVSLVAVPRFLMDKNYRKFLLKQVKDSFLLKYWQEEYETLGQTPKLLNDAISPILNKVGRFLSSTMIRNMMGQIKSTVDLADAMNTGKILLINLSQGKIGEENSSLLGGMLITRLYSNAMQRAKIEESQRRDFYLYVDEFQNFASDSFLKILSEARKYGLALIITHQYIDQIDQNLRNAIFGNVGTMLNYVVGNKDAEVLAREYEPYLTANDLINLDRFHLALKMTIDGQQSKPFTAIALKPFYKKVGRSDYIKNLSRRKYAKNRQEIEFKLNKWALTQYDKNGNLIQKNPQGETVNKDKNSKDQKVVQDLNNSVSNKKENIKAETKNSNNYKNNLRSSTRRMRNNHVSSNTSKI